MIKLIFVMGCGWGYGNYRNKNIERVVYDFEFLVIIICCFLVCVFLGVFWGGIRYTLHVFFMRGVIKYDENIVLRAVVGNFTCFQ